MGTIFRMGFVNPEIADPFPEKPVADCINLSRPEVKQHLNRMDVPSILKIKHLNFPLSSCLQDSGHGNLASMASARSIQTSCIFEYFSQDEYCSHGSCASNSFFSSAIRIGDQGAQPVPE